MWMDVTELRDFYATPLGQVSRRFVRRRIREFWPHARGLDVLGLGYATPFLKPYLESANRVIGFMPAGQGCEAWPCGDAPLTALVDEMALPLPDVSVDRVLLVHGIENSESLRAMMREIWRVLAPEGRLLVVAPNRRGLWARMETTPFGHGHPFSQRQLGRFLGECMFEAERSDYALFMPPMRWSFMLKSGGAWEDAGTRFWRGFGGVLLVEAVKRVAVVPGAKRQTVFRPVGELAGGRWRRPVGAPSFKD